MKIVVFPTPVIHRKELSTDFDYMWCVHGGYVALFSCGYIHDGMRHHIIFARWLEYKNPAQVRQDYSTNIERIAKRQPSHLI